MDASWDMEETTLDFAQSFMQDEVNLSDFAPEAHPIPPQHHQGQELQLEEIQYSDEDLAAIQEINDLFESAPSFNEINPEFDQAAAAADQNLRYLEEQQFSSEGSFDDESIYMDEAMYTEFEDLDANTLMMLMGSGEDEAVEEMEDDDESFHRVPSPAESVVSARYARFPQP